MKRKKANKNRQGTKNSLADSFKKQITAIPLNIFEQDIGYLISISFLLISTTEGVVR